MNVNFQPQSYKLYYYLIMKKRFFILSIILLTSNTVFALQDADKRKEAYEAMIASHKLQHETCLNVADNFRYDHQFAGYMRSKCIFYESDRQRLLTSVFTISSRKDTQYKEQYPILMSKFAIDMNNREIESYKKIAEEYCKYNSYKFVKKDPQACSTARLESLFSAIQ